MHSQKLRFDNERGERLAAYLDLPANGRPAAFALFAHCFTCGKNLKAINHISQALTARRLGVLRFDFTGLGESEGDFADTSFSSNVADLVAAARFLEREHGAPQVLIGHSLGGAAVLQAAAEIPSARAVATVAAPAEPGHVTHLLGESRATIEGEGEAEVTLAGRRFRIRKQFLDDLDGRRMEATIRGLRRALLVLHSPLDDTVGVDNAARIFQAALHPKSYVSLDDADHLLSRERDSRYVGEVVSAWAGRYLDLPAPAPVRTVADGNRVVSRTDADAFRTEVVVRGHTLVADEPRDVGGEDTGPTPYDLLLAALGACTGMTLRMYARHKQLPLESATVRLGHEKVHARDCEACETREGYIDRIQREVELVGELTAAQRTALLAIAEKCPVHRTLHSEVVVETRLRS